MGLFSRRKSSVGSLAGPGSHRPQSAYDKTLQLHPLPGEEGAVFILTPPSANPSDDQALQANNGAGRKSSLSRRFSKRRHHTTEGRPATSQSDFSTLPKLAPKTTKQNERPLVAASRFFLSNEPPISPTARALPPSRGRIFTNSISLPDNISVTISRSALNARPLRVKSFDLLKSNPRLEYLHPDLLPPPPPPPTRAGPDGELQFRHDGRGLFASKTVANIADELDTRGLRKLLERDSRRQGRHQSNDDLRRYYLSPEISRRSPQSRGSESNAQRTTDYGKYGYSDGREYDWYRDPGPSTIRPVAEGDQSDNSIDQQFHLGDSWRMPGDGPQRQEAAISIETSSGMSSLPPILLFGQQPKAEPSRSDRRKSPIILLAPNSTRPKETSSWLPSSPIKPSIPLYSQPNPQFSPSRRPRLPIVTPGTESIASTQDMEHETTDGFGSDTPHDLTDLDPDSFNDSPLASRENVTVPNPSDQRFSPQKPKLTNPIPLARSDSTGSSNSHYNSDNGEDEEILSTPIIQPHLQWGESPIVGTSIPTWPLPQTETPARDSPVESEGSWLSGKMDIQQAVLKSFHTGSVSRRTPPIILESSPMPPAVAITPLKVDTIAAVAAMNATKLASAGSMPLSDEDKEYESGGDGDAGEPMDGRNRVRQGSAARQVEILDSPIVEGVVGQVSWERVERTGDPENGDIVLI